MSERGIGASYRDRWALLGHVKTRDFSGTGVPELMPILGAHMSISGGFHKAIERAVNVGCDCVQIFTKNSNQWNAKDITQEGAEWFRRALEDSVLTSAFAHDSYLINLASPDDAIWRRSVNGLIDELRRAELLGIRSVVTHPGAYTTGSERRGIRRIVRSLNEIHRRTRSLNADCVLETTAGQGTTLGWQFGQLAEILDRVEHPERMGFCFDTCHVFAAGYPLCKREEYEVTMMEFDRLIGVDRIRVFHLNDSRREQGSRVDRHAHIGRGAMGVAPFRHILQDDRFQQTPMILETPKGTEGGDDLDRLNLGMLRRLAE